MNVFFDMPVSVSRIFSVLLALLLAVGCACARVLSKDYLHLVKKTTELQVEQVLRFGDGCLERGQKDKALVYYMVACSRLRDDMPDRDRQQVALAHLKKGNVYYMNGGYASALEAYVKGIKIYETCGVQREIGRFYNNIGNIYCIFQDYEKGLSYYNTGYKFCRKYGDKANEYKILVNMTGICTFQGDAVKARRYYLMSERLRDSSDKVGSFMSRFNHGLILVAENKDYEALSIFRSSAAYAAGNRLDSRYLCSVYQQMYRIWMRLGEADSTAAYLSLCERTAVGSGVLHHFVDILSDRAVFCDAQGDFVTANKYRKRYIREKDSIFNIREFDIAKNIQFVYEMEKTGRQIAHLNAREKERLSTISSQRSAIFAVACVAFVVIVLLAVVYRQKKRLNKSYADLFTVNRDFVDTHERMRQRLVQVGVRLDEVLVENRRLLRACCDSDSADDPSVRKYSSSSLDDEGKQRLADAVTDIMENTEEFCSADFSLDRLSSLVGSNSKYVSQVINDTYHKNFSNYVNEYRIRLACLRMADRKGYGMYTLNSIAESVGFKSYSTFVAIFRKTTGITPSIYKEKIDMSSCS